MSWRTSRRTLRRVTCRPRSPSPPADAASARRSSDHGTQCAARPPPRSARIIVELLERSIERRPGLHVSLVIGARDRLCAPHDLDGFQHRQHGSTAANSAVTTALIASPTTSPMPAIAASANRAPAWVPASRIHALIRQPHRPQVVRPELASV